MTYKYFDLEKIHCAEDGKKQYRRLAVEHHPDRGGETATMQRINAEWEALWPTIRDTHQDTKTAGQYYQSKTKSTEEAGEFIHIITHLLRMDGLTVELCGRWLWIGGETMQHKEALKAIGCRWSSKKRLWSWHHREEGARRGRREWGINEIRSAYGSEIYAQGYEQLKIG